jgi:hypothetical protein
MEEISAGQATSTARSLPDVDSQAALRSQTPKTPAREEVLAWEGHMADWETESRLQPRKVYIQEAAVVRQPDFANKLELSSYNNGQCQTEEG